MTEEQTTVEEMRESPPPEESDEEQILSFVRDDVEVEVIEGEVVAEESETPAEEVDELTALRQQLAAAQAQADEYLDDLRRERAAFQNYKKRQGSERAELRQMAQANLLVQLLPILDDMERALEAVPQDQEDASWVEGVVLIQRKLQSTLKGTGMVAIGAEPGHPFDPFVHEAVSYEENEDYQEGEIIAVLQQGYKLGERVLRPAVVRIAK